MSWKGCLTWRTTRPVVRLVGFTRVPLYSLVFLCRATGGELAAHPAALVIVDPLYLAVAGAATGADLYGMGAVLAGIQAVCQHAGAALVVVTHWNKTGEGRGAKRISGVGPGAWGRVLASVGTTQAAFEPDEVDVAIRERAGQYRRDDRVSHVIRMPATPSRDRKSSRRAVSSSRMWIPSRLWLSGFCAFTRYAPRIHCSLPLHCCGRVGDRTAGRCIRSMSRCPNRLPARSRATSRTCAGCSVPTSFRPEAAATRSTSPIPSRCRPTTRADSPATRPLAALNRLAFEDDFIVLGAQRTLPTRCRIDGQPGRAGGPGAEPRAALVARRQALGAVREIHTQLALETKPDLGRVLEQLASVATGVR